MSIESNNKDKSMLYSMMKITTDYDSRWIDGNMVKYDKVQLKRTSDRIYNSKKAILKYYTVEMDNLEENLNEEIE